MQSPKHKALGKRTGAKGGFHSHKENIDVIRNAPEIIKRKKEQMGGEKAYRNRFKDAMK